MKEYAFRLRKGDDLRKSLQEYTMRHHIDTAVVVSAVGCLTKLHLRMAKAEVMKYFEKDFEIVSLTGTISKSKPHLHISCSDESGRVIGGHLLEGSIANTTVEVVLLELEEYQSHREMDKTTGYDEILFERR